MPLDSEKKPTLLLVDDDAIIADSLEYVLREEYRIERASDRQSSFPIRVYLKRKLNIRA